MRISRRWQLSVPALALVALAAAGCGSSASTSSSSAGAATAVRISTRSLPGLGPVLVNAEGRTLYMFVPDRRKRVSCVGSCAAVWPPVMIPGDQKAVASGGAKQALLGSDPDPQGGQVVTYAGWPLYAYAADPSPGSATGQGLNINGGLWYVLAPSGKVIRKTP